MVFKRSKQTDTVLFVYGDENKEVRLRQGKSILDLAIENDVPLDHSCTAGTCGSCRVIVLEGASSLEERGEVEAETALERGLGPDERLACQIEACSRLKLKIPNV